MQNLAPLAVSGTVGEKVKSYENWLGQRADRERRRDERFASQLAALCQQNSASEILVMRGAIHQRALERFLCARNVRFESRLSHKPMRMYPESEIISRLEIGEAACRRELLMAIAEVLEIQTRCNDPKTLKIAKLAQVQNELGSLSEEDLRTRYLAGSP